MYLIELNLSNRPKGAPVEIAGLGKLINGQSTEVTEEQAKRFKNANRHLWRGKDPDATLVEVLEGNNILSVQRTDNPENKNENAPAGAALTTGSSPPGTEATKAQGDRHTTPTVPKVDKTNNSDDKKNEGSDS